MSKKIQKSTKKNTGIAFGISNFEISLNGAVLRKDRQRCVTILLNAAKLVLSPFADVDLIYSCACLRVHPASVEKHTIEIIQDARGQIAVTLLTGQEMISAVDDMLTEIDADEMQKQRGNWTPEAWNEIGRAFDKFVFALQQLDGLGQEIDDCLRSVGTVQ